MLVATINERVYNGGEGTQNCARYKVALVGLSALGVIVGLLVLLGAALWGLIRDGHKRVSWAPPQAGLAPYFEIL